MRTVPLTNKEIKEIALGLSSGTIFSDRHLRNGNDLGMVFPVLMLADSETRKEIVDAVMPEGVGGPQGMIYEWIDQASPRSVNGYPMFFSLKFLTPDEVDRVNATLAKIEAALEEEE